MIDYYGVAATLLSGIAAILLAVIVWVLIPDTIEACEKARGVHECVCEESTP